MSSYLITGASRGLGLEFVTQLAAYPTSQVSVIFATARGKAPALEKLVQSSSGRIVQIQLDVDNEDSIKKAAAVVETKLNGKGLDVLINNAGILEMAPDVSRMDNLISSFTTNVLGVHWVTREFLPLLQKGQGKKIANISSTVGSIAYSQHMTHLSCPAYKVTKAALNSLTVQYSLQCEKEGFTIFALSPGWLRTDLGGEYADLSVQQGATASLEKILGAGKEQNGQFLNIKIDEKETGISHYTGANAAW